MFTSQLMYLIVFILAITHTLLAQYLLLLEKYFPRSKKLLHALTEIEIIFPVWAALLCLLILLKEGSESLVNYVQSLDFTESIFVIAIMTVAGTKPILVFIENTIIFMVKQLPFKPAISIYCLALTLLPLLGSLITEPAAMTLAAILLKQTIFPVIRSEKLKYGILAVLLINISIGGALTPFAAPPILMVAKTWNWDLYFMLSHFGLNILIIVLMNTLLGLSLFYKDFQAIQYHLSLSTKPINLKIVLSHLIFLLLMMYFSHSLSMFVGILVIFIVFTRLFSVHQDPLLIKEATLVGLFLMSLIVVGSKQSWWLTTLFSSINDWQVYLGTTLLTAVADNAALTYLGSLLPHPSESFKLALVKGAIAGGGLTLIANAPNPIASNLLKTFFNQKAILAKPLIHYAILPTLLTLIGLLL